jgi:hypothetical protein
MAATCASAKTKEGRPDEPNSYDVLVARGFLEKNALPQFIAAGLKR